MHSFLTEIPLRRLISHRLAGNPLDGSKKVVSHMTAMQAQDLSMVKWSIGIRSGNLKEPDIEHALSRHVIIRTHVLRPTWHVVDHNDIGTLLQLSAPQIRKKLRSRHRQLGITEHTEKKAMSILASALENNELSRDEIRLELINGGVDIGENRLSHYLMLAELEGLIHNGTIKGSKQMYCLANINMQEGTDEEKTVTNLAERYFTSHGPATIDDFVWWSGLQRSQVSCAVPHLNAKLETMILNGTRYWYRDNGSEAIGSDIIPLPSYDEYIIAYANRSAVLKDEHLKTAISKNGVFWPVLLQDGMVIGTWKRKVLSSAIDIEIRHFRAANQSTRKRVEQGFAGYQEFTGKQLVFSYKGH